MEKRRIGSLEVSCVGLGCNNFGRRLNAGDSAKVVNAALDAGINFFDTADVYGNTKSEEFLGRALGNRRDDVVIATKFGMRIDDSRTGAHPEYVVRAVEDSLKRLNTDQIDLYQIHTPDDTVPIADTLGALDQLVKSGKVREIGCSNFTVEQLREAEHAVAPGGARLVSVQNEYNLLNRDTEKGLLQECAAAGIAFLPYFPLANGLLTGKYRKGEPPPQGSRIASGWNAALMNDENLEIIEKLRAFAESRDRTLLELAVSWLIERPMVASVIAGATTPAQVRANVAASGWDMTETEIQEINRISPPRFS